MKKKILSLLLLLIPALVHSTTEESVIISKITMKPIPFNERRDPVSDSPFNAFDGDAKSAALYSDFSMEFEKPVTMDKIMFINGNSSSKELFIKNNRLRDIEITLYTVESKPDSITENNIMNGDIKLYFVSGTYEDEDKSVEKIELDKLMDRINIQILGENTDTKDNTPKDEKTETEKKDKKTDKKKSTKKSASKKTPVKKKSNKDITDAKKITDSSAVKKIDKVPETQTKTSRIVKLDNDKEGRVLVYISLNDSMEYQSVDLKTQYIVKRIDFRAMEDEYYKGSEPDRTAITEIIFSNKGKSIPFQNIDSMKQRYIENYNKALKESLSNMNFVLYENNDITMRLEIKEDGSMEFIDRYKCKNKGGSDCTQELMPVMWRITDGKLYMRYHTVWRLWKYELDSQSDIINYTENLESPRWMKIYFKSDNGFTDKYLDLVK